MSAALILPHKAEAMMDEQGEYTKPAPSRNEWMQWTSAVEHLTTIPDCGLEALAKRTPEENAQLTAQAQQAIANINAWMKVLRQPVPYLLPKTTKPLSHKGA
jgi:hypothetical protein